MSRVHDALRRAELGGLLPQEEPPPIPADLAPPAAPPEPHAAADGVNGVNGMNGLNGVATSTAPLRLNIQRPTLNA